MDYAHPDALVSTEWLAARLDDPHVKPVDATWFLPEGGRDAHIEFELRHVPGAVFFDIDEVADPGTDLPHMLPDAQTFGAKVGGLGIGSDDLVVCYDAVGGFCAAQRAWWMFRVFGHHKVAVLDGGLPKWMREKRPVEKGLPEPEPARFAARGPDAALVRHLDQVRANLDTRAEQLLDARSEKRYAGIDHEPRPTEKRGHIPGSINLPFTRLMRDASGDFTMRPADELAQVFAEAGVDLSKPVTTTCGSGVTACVPAFALYLLGKADVAVYDGSWAEWGNRDDTPVGP